MEPVESQENQQDQQDTQVQDAMSAGFNKVRGEEPPADVPPQDVVTEQAQAAEPVKEPEANAEAPATASATETDTAANAATVEEDDPIVPGIGLKASEVKNLLAKAAQLDKVQESIEAKVSQRMFGKFGEVQRAINELKTASSGQSLKLTTDKLKRLHAEYPEVADLLAEDLSEVLTAPAGTFTKDEVDQIVADKLTEKSSEVELKLLTIAHPDWYENRHSPEFSIWLSTLPSNVGEAVQTSQDSVFLTKAFTGFKAWKGAALEAKKAADDSAAAAAKQKIDKRLEGGITPKGVTPAAPPLPTASSAMQAGFKKVRGP